MQLIFSCLEGYNSEGERGFVIVKVNNSNCLVLGYPSTCQVVADNGEGSNLPRWDQQCGYTSPKYQPVPSAFQTVLMGVRGLPRPPSSFVIAVM